MRHGPIEKLPPDLAALLAVERRAPAPPAARKARILASLQPIVSGAGGTMATAPVSGTQALWSKFILVASLTCAVSFGGAIALSRRPSGGAPPLSARIARAEPAIAPAPEPPIGTPASEIAARPAPPHPARRRRPTTPANMGGANIDLETLRAEAAVLERARRELAAGDAPAALTTLADAERQFPLGALVEEREALAIRSLAAAGQHAAARDRAAAFTREHPTSIQAATIAAALRAEIR